ncbi:MAG: AraC family transcriptional regulator [Ectothiorhodospiraceae bacterium]|nr:AraC family transcriptional regulator [Ectothiorhodospiraceae bacterium]
MEQAPVPEFRLPSEDLKPWIDFYVQHVSPASTGRCVTRFPSSASATLTLVLAGKAGFRDSGVGIVRPLPPAFISGPQTGPGLLVTSGGFRCLIVVFAPGCWHGLIQGVPVSLLNARQDVGTLGCGWLRALPEQLTAAPRQSMWEILEAAMRRWLDGGAVRQGAACFSRADTGWIRDALLRTDPGSAAKAYGLSLRQVERRFIRQFGLSPKVYQRLARTALLITRLGLRPEGAGLAGLAMELGYADQSHLSRDLKRFTGVQPGRLRGLLEKDSEYWAYRVLPRALASGARMSRFFKTA